MRGVGEPCKICGNFTTLVADDERSDQLCRCNEEIARCVTCENLVPLLTVTDGQCFFCFRKKKQQKKQVTEAAA